MYVNGPFIRHCMAQSNKTVGTVPAVGIQYTHDEQQTFATNSSAEATAVVSQCTSLRRLFIPIGIYSLNLRLFIYLHNLTNGVWMSFL